MHISFITKNHFLVYLVKSLLTWQNYYFTWKWDFSTGKIIHEKILFYRKKVILYMTVKQQAHIIGPIHRSYITLSLSIFKINTKGILLTSTTIFTSVRYGLVVRIPGSHPGGPGSIPGIGRFFVLFFCDFYFYISLFTH